VISNFEHSSSQPDAIQVLARLIRRRSSGFVASWPLLPLGAQPASPGGRKKPAGDGSGQVGTRFRFRYVFFRQQSCASHPEFTPSIGEVRAFVPLLRPISRFPGFWDSRQPRRSLTARTRTRRPPVGHIRAEVIGRLFELE
jgi:hypothetical protein